MLIGDMLVMKRCFNIVRNCMPTIPEMRLETQLETYDK